MRYAATLFAFAVLAALLALPAAASRPVVTVNGGGMALFDPDDGPDPERFATTNFAVGAHLRQDGTASGHFTCVIPSFVTITGNITKGTLNPDGSVTIEGIGTIADPVNGAAFVRVEPFTVTFWEGGPGSGRFHYIDTIADDFETVATGNIKITGNE